MPERAWLPAWLALSLTAALGLQLTRVFIASTTFYLVEALGLDSRIAGLLAFGVFASAFAAGLVLRLAGPGRAPLLVIAGVAVVRLAVQIAGSPAADVVLAGVGTFLFTILVPVALHLAEPLQVSMGFLAGLAIDAAIQLAGETLDLAWQEGSLPLVVVGVLGAVAVAALARTRQHLPPAGGMALVGLGPLLFLHAVVLQNGGFVAAVTGWGLPGVAAVVAAGNVLGLSAAGLAPRLTRPIMISAGTVFPILISMLNRIDGPWAAGALLAAHGTGGLLMAAAFHSGDRERAVAGNGVGMLAFVALLFLYYAGYQFRLGFRSSVVLIVAAVAAVGPALGWSKDRERIGRSVLAPAAAAVVLLIVPLGLLATGQAPRPEPTFDGTVRVMTYNLHQGFDTTGRLDLEELAQVIETAAPDIVALQEVSRGWVVDGSVDMLTWLARRLRMAYVEGPTADRQWGNAILSRYPVSSSSNRPLPPRWLPLRRGFLDATIGLGRAEIRVLATHLHHVDADDVVRQDQVKALVAAWDSSPATVLAGDLNAVPESQPIALLREAGMVDAGAGNPQATSPSPQPQRRIDYVWLSPDLALLNVEVPRSTASDHLPVVVTVGYPG